MQWSTWGTRFGGSGLMRGIALVWALCLVSATLAGEGADRLDAHLRAGEFGPALDAAKALSVPAERDRWLGKIAECQAAVGARQASQTTLAQIQDDLARRDSLAAISGAARSGGAGGSFGGAAMADFDTLINLITSTIAPESWEEVGGAGAIESFPTGVFVDSAGLMKRLGPPRTSTLLDHSRESAIRDSGNRRARESSTLRKVSLTRLEKMLQLRQAFGEQPDEAMRVLAGLQSVKYVFVYPELGDIVLAGPAGDWRTDDEGRAVSVENGKPVLQLDDLVAVLRNAYKEEGRFGCVIKPRTENLAAARAFQESWNNRPIKPGQRDEWLEQLRAALGKQDIKVWGLNPGTRTARVLLEADYRMKLVGMGLEEGTLGVSSYLDEVKRSRKAPPAMNVLRWWFTLNYEHVNATESRDAFELCGPGVKVLSENELLTETGERIHTGKSDELTAGFARSFTQHIEVLAAKYPIYAELKNVFDLALVAGLLKSHDLPAQVGWHLTYFGDERGFPLTIGPVPKEVDSVVNSVTLDRSLFVAGVSGGVSVDTGSVVAKPAVVSDNYGLMGASRVSGQPQGDLPPDTWWWD